MLASLSDGTIRQYEKPIRLWFNFCKEKNISLFDATISEILQFLTERSHEVKTYGTLNCYRSALSLISKKELGSDASVKRFFKGFSVQKPQSSKYTDTWDPQVVLESISKMGQNACLSLENLSKKLIMLMALATAQRVQTLSKIRVENIKIGEKIIKIVITDKIKTSGIGRAQPILEFPFFNNEPNLCVAKTLIEYLNKTKDVRLQNSEFLFLTYKKPHHPCSTQTLSRWIKDILNNSGIDTNIYKGHSTRHASTSAAARKGVNVEIIRQAAGWSSNSKIFANFYNRPLKENLCQFASTVFNQ